MRKIVKCRLSAIVHEKIRTSSFDNIKYEITSPKEVHAEKKIIIRKHQAICQYNANN